MIFMVNRLGQGVTFEVAKAHLRSGMQRDDYHSFTISEWRNTRLGPNTGVEATIVDGNERRTIFLMKVGNTPYTITFPSDADNDTTQAIVGSLREAR
jgi:hypothetical protein